MTNKEYHEIEEICTNICRNKQLLPDLIQEVSLIFLETNERKKEAIRTYFKYWVVRVVSNSWNSNTSPFWTKFRNTLPVDPNSLYDLSEEQPESECGYSNDEILTKLIDELYISDQNVFKDYYYKGLTIMDITKKYSAEKTFIWSMLDRIRTSLKRRVSWLEGKPLDLSVLKDMQNKPRLKVAERQYIIDIHNHKNSEYINNIHNRDQINSILNELIANDFER